MSNLLNKVLLRSASLCSATLVVSTAVASISMLTAQAAGNMYIYKDDSGQVLLTNVKPSGNFDKYSKKVKVTYYPNTGSEQEARNNKTLPKLNPPSYYSNQEPVYPGASYSNQMIGASNHTYDHYILASANRHGVDPGLLKAMMHTESGFNPNARSPVGAQGLMQLMPATARRFKVSNAWNPSENIEGAAKYVAWLSKRFNGKTEHILAGYNAGEGNVDKYGGIPPFKETRNYVKRVLDRYNSLYRNSQTLTASYNNANIPSFATTSNGYSQEAFDILRQRSAN
ncbi:lytic transglycosylase domain-containing protein [Psychrobacter sp. FDAARGOS_221]|uniref:lytic transglycosylase domain-containing protein n=1 Tax=Psychrobacter sp. FDAARGOS_221 TaxID=1975705 RepID=UPI000BB53B79|nr:lytic transglycosylase domain-containing protein [Psychrobacter sp. FDAARGOS_221]PNK61290.1 lytic transglycosylase domain-containing protein [Psychrobacter sp. FDAARGOS_221]